jgi:aspartyl-tRNA(Asn)/glutamyl-tRNA(Gln) amidotransferase subunit A
MFNRAGWITECGSRSMRGFRPAFTAKALERLDDAGAIDLGRLAMSEFAIGASGHNPGTGTPRNPWDLARLAGGTSSGPAAAVAARLVPAALASDTGGSTRLPAAFCGIVGFKPSYGLIDRSGMFPASPTLDHVGIMARSADDCALLLDALAEPHARARPEPAPSEPTRFLSGLRIGVPRRYFADDLSAAEESVFSASLDLVRHVGAKLVPVDIPDIDAANPLASLIIMVEACAIHRRRLANRASEYLPETLERLATGMRYGAIDYRAALMARVHLLMRLANHGFAQADVLVTPVAATAPRADGADLPPGTGFAAFAGAAGKCLRAFNLTGLPAITIPAGLSDKGLPLSIQLVARPFADWRLLRAAAAFEASRGPFAAPPAHTGDRLAQA